MTAAAKRSVAGTPTTGPITISITDGGIRMPSVPAGGDRARPTSGCRSRERFIAGAAITPSSVTDEPTMPVAAAKIVAVSSTAR